MDALFTENWSKVVATVHVPYMNTSCLWGKTCKKEKKKEENAETQRLSKHYLSRVLGFAHLLVSHVLGAVH